MIKETVTYTDFNGQQVTEDLYFHLTRAEMVELEASQEGGVGNAMEEISKSTKVHEVIPCVKKFLLAGYGVRSADGRTFSKSEDLRNAFQATEAYSSLFMSIASVEGKAATFFNGLVPENFREDPTGTGAPMTPRERSEQNVQGYQQARRPETKLADPAEVRYPQEIQSAPVEQTLQVAQQSPAPTVETDEQKRARLWAELESLDGK